MANTKTVARSQWTDHELGLIKATFADQEELLILIRKFLLQGEMMESEMKYLKSIATNPEVLAILKKSINPTLDKQAAPFNSVDLFTSTNYEPTPVEHAYRLIKARELAKRYLDQQFAELVDGKPSTFVFDNLIISTDDEDQTFINNVARNFLVSYIDFQLFNKLAIVAGTKEETPEQQKQRLTKNSNK